MLLLDTMKNCYEKNKQVKSILCIGNPNATPNPYVTIAIPAYRRANLLYEALHSAINQEDAPFQFEIIVVDDEVGTIGMSQTETIVRSFTCDKLLYYRNQENLGLFGNINRCVELARGNWIAFLHDDDLLDTNYLKNIAGYISKKRKMAVLIPERRFFGKLNSNEDTNVNNNTGTEVKKIIKKYLEKSLIKMRPIDNYIWNYNIYLAPTCGTLFDRNVLLKFGGFREEWFPSSDWFLMFCLNKKYPVYKTVKCLGSYRIHDSESFKEKNIIAFFRQQEEYREYAKQHSICGYIMYHLFRYERHYQSFISLTKWNVLSDKLTNLIIDILPLRHRPIRLAIYEWWQRIYWKTKKILSIVRR